MTHKNKRKGTYHEKWFVDWLIKLGIKAKRQPLSGSLGGEYRGDIILSPKNKNYIAEVKYRTTEKFPSPFKVLDKRDIAFYKRKTGEPQVIVIMSAKTFEEIIRDTQNETNNTT